ncbi:MAG: tetratricopeptide repeat protein [Pseudomonadota bacterium]
MYSSWNARALLRSLTLCALLLWAPLAAQAQQERLDVDTARELIFSLLQQGQPAAAADAARAVLAGRPDDIPALLGLTQALIGLGQSAEAARAGQRAWSLSTLPEDRFASAMVTAQALARSERKLLAQFWLRRAFQVAPSPVAKAAAARDLRQLRRITPLRVQLDFDVEPSSNINGGARSDRFFGGTIGGTSLALSGVAYTASADLTYSLPPRGRRLNAFKLNGIWRTYTLSDEAKRIAPDARGSDFDYQEVEVAWEATYLLPRGRFSHGITLGRSWSGGEDLERFIGADLFWSRAISDRQRITLGYEFEDQDRLDTSIRSSTLHGVSIGWVQGTEPGIWAISARIADKDSDSAIVANVGRSLSVSFIPREPLVGTANRFSAIYEERDFDEEIIFGLRRDKTTQLSLDITFGGVDYYGFSPTLDLTARRTESTINLYDADTFSIGFGLTSLF